MLYRSKNIKNRPRGWNAAATAVKKRAGYKCEQPGCRVRDHMLGAWGDDGKFWPALATGTDGMRITLPRVGEWAWCRSPRGRVEQLCIIRIKLAVIAVATRPGPCSSDDLRLWCQRHRQQHQTKLRAEARFRHERARRASGDLFAP